MSLILHPPSWLIIRSTKMRLKADVLAPTTGNDDSYHRSVDVDLNRQLSQLSSSAKCAVSLNQISHVAILHAYNREVNGAHVTIYVADVFLLGVQKVSPQGNKKKLTWHQTPKKERNHPEYQVEHRYSSFRHLRQRILDVMSVASTGDNKHLQCCAYCSRVLWLVTEGEFPSRYPNKGAVAGYTGWRQLLMHSRKHGLEKFINELLTAAKDVSCRYTTIQCERYATVSGLLKNILGDQARPERDAVR
ncbi:hypothetical protein P3T76_007273 [Phytophthora citrophthora]|uniref:PX domain-containing protein n=1 Tax=Phytophthora citrophthora TaxID=4793 RepID=A0AAD9LN33_9STRA|nr:hypothetical protein P3T76_007273 [Phytophthora citrophthora]